MSNESGNFWLSSYSQHIEHDSKNSDKKKVESWKHFDTIDAWRHKRMLDTLLPLIKNRPNGSWLTVGDGRYGTDANYLLRNGAKKVLATSISDTFLRKAREENFITEYQTENAEKLSFSDNSFDYILCKESYHHFPRPMVALYEMLRVAKEGVVLIEPKDKNVEIKKSGRSKILTKGRWQTTKDYIKDMLGISRYKYSPYDEPNYETVGNYVFSISERDIEKVALGLNLPFIAFKGLNDCYQEGVEFEKATDESILFNHVKSEISKANKRCELGIAEFGLLVTVILKVNPDELLEEAFRLAKFNINYLPRNPYSNNT